MAPVESLPSLRLATWLNSLLARQVSSEVASAAVVADDVAHHVVDPGGVLGVLDNASATPLAAALPLISSMEPEHWILELPLPGMPGCLRGPRELTDAAIGAGEVVLAASGRVALVPHQVGRAVQWRAFAANRPATPATPYEAERALSEAVLSAAQTLARLDVAAGSRPRTNGSFGLPPGYRPRQQATAERALRLLVACDLALLDDGRSISSFEVDVRARQLRMVRDASVAALCAAVSWIDAP